MIRKKLKTYLKDYGVKVRVYKKGDRLEVLLSRYSNFEIKDVIFIIARYTNANNKGEINYSEIRIIKK